MRLGMASGAVPSARRSMRNTLNRRPGVAVRQMARQAMSQVASQAARDSR